MQIKAKESQNQIQFENYKKHATQLGPYTTHIWETDPRHLCFLLSRYKFVAKMLQGKKKILEVGVGDAFGVPVVTQIGASVHGVDWEPLLMDDNNTRLANVDCTFECIDITKQSPTGEFDAAYSLDVIEHIPSEREHLYIENTCKALGKHGVFIVGTPNITSQAYASEASRIGHINLKSANDLSGLMSKYFNNVFSFSMNDEVVHTGYSPMAHYIFAMGVGVKS